jgi:hypothetical protein
VGPRIELWGGLLEQRLWRRDGRRLRLGGTVTACLLALHAHSVTLAAALLLALAALGLLLVLASRSLALSLLVTGGALPLALSVRRGTLLVSLFALATLFLAGEPASLAFAGRRIVGEERIVPVRRALVHSTCSRRDSR